jgi:hypothetical protein
MTVIIETFLGRKERTMNSDGSANTDLVTLPSAHGVTETVERLKALLAQKGIEVFAHIPELEVLRCLPAETLVDGELVAFDADGRPDLPRLLRRHGLTDPWRIRHAPHWCPVRYVLFDLLYHEGRCLVREPLVERRAVLAELCQRLEAANVHFSAFSIGAHLSPTLVG